LLLVGELGGSIFLSGKGCGGAVVLFGYAEATVLAVRLGALPYGLAGVQAVAVRGYGEGLGGTRAG